MLDFIVAHLNATVGFLTSATGLAAYRRGLFSDTQLLALPIAFFLLLAANHTYRAVLAEDLVETEQLGSAAEIGTEASTDGDAGLPADGNHLEGP